MKKKDIKIAFIMPPSDCVNNDRLEPPLGMLYIIAVLRENGYHEIELYDMSGCENDIDIENKINNIPFANIYGLTIYCTNHNFIKPIIKRIKEINDNALLIGGGPNPTALPQIYLDDLGFDIVITGEGEDMMLSVINKYYNSELYTGILNGNGRNNIDSYPFPARDIVKYSTYTKKLLGIPSVSMITSRGCKYNCLHCNSIVMGGSNPNPRYRSVENTLKEIEEISKYFSCIRFVDDNFTSNPNIEHLLDGLRDYNIQFRIFGKVDDLSDGICKKLTKAGCVHVTVGLESLNPDNLKALGKSNQIGMWKNIKIAKDNGLTVRSSFMVGLPYDNESNIEKYFTQAAQLKFDEFEIVPLIPFPGSRISKSLKQWGYNLINDDFTSYVLVGKNRRTTFALEHLNFSVEDVKKWRKWIEDIFVSYGKKYMKDSNVAE